MARGPHPATPDPRPKGLQSTPWIVSPRQSASRSSTLARFHQVYNNDAALNGNTRKQRHAALQREAASPSTNETCPRSFHAIQLDSRWCCQYQDLDSSTNICFSSLQPLASSFGVERSDISRRLLVERPRVRAELEAPGFANCPTDARTPPEEASLDCTGARS